MHEFPEHLAKLGHEVGFVHFPEGYTQAQIKELGYRKRIAGRVVSGVELDLFTPWAISGSFQGRLLTAVFSYWQFRRVLSDFKPDVVVSFSVPTSGWQALMACKRARVPYVFRALDVSHKIRKGLFSWLVKQAEKYIYSNADALSANNPAMLDYCVGVGVRTGPAGVDLPPLDLSHFGAAVEDLESLRSQLGIRPSDRVILYMGSFFYFSGLPEVIQSMQSAPQDVKLVLVGGGEQDVELRGQVLKAGLETTVLFAGFVSFEELPRHLKLADIAINSMHRSLVSNTAFPNKVIQYLASGVPVVSTRLKGLEMTFGESPALRYVESPENVLAVAIDVLEAGEASDLESRALELVKDRFEISRNVLGFESRLLKLVKSGS
jgi:glycosyltransferase involved in cell wall biosynthesis